MRRISKIKINEFSLLCNFINYPVIGYSGPGEIYTFWYQPLNKIGHYTANAQSTSKESYGFREALINNNSFNTLTANINSNWWLAENPYSGMSPSIDSVTLSFPIEANNNDVSMVYVFTNYGTSEADALSFTYPNSINWYVDDVQESTSTSLNLTSDQAKKLKTVTVNAEGSRVDIVLEKTGAGDKKFTFHIGTSPYSGVTVSCLSPQAGTSWLKTYGRESSDEIWFTEGDQIKFESSEWTSGSISFNGEIISSEQIEAGQYTLNTAKFIPYTSSGAGSVLAQINSIFITGTWGPIGRGDKSVNVNWTGTGSFDVYYNDSYDSYMLPANYTGQLKYDSTDSSINFMSSGEAYVQIGPSGTPSYSGKVILSLFNMTNLSSQGNTLVVNGTWKDIGTGDHSATFSVQSSDYYMSDLLVRVNGTTIASISTAVTTNLKFNVGDIISFDSSASIIGERDIETSSENIPVSIQCSYEGGQWNITYSV